MTDKLFYDTLRPHFGGTLLTTQIGGINDIIRGWYRYAGIHSQNMQMLAYTLATAKWETASTMQPIHERGPLAYFNKYEPGTPIGKRLGNTVAGDGYRFRGRGYVQLTGRDNYRRVGELIDENLIADPERALVPEIAVRILVEGMLRGWFTGKKLGNYIDDIDEDDKVEVLEFGGARRVVNAQDKAKEIAASALVFEHALTAAPVLPAQPPEPVELPPRVEEEFPAPAPLDEDHGIPIWVIVVAVAVIAFAVYYFFLMPR